MTKAKDQKKSLAAVGMRPLKLWQDDGGTPDLRVEIIPLIDVIFCILTFFILAAVNMSRQQAINLNLPAASSSTAQMPNMAIVSLTDFGQIYVENQLIQSQTQFSQILKDYLARNPNGMIVLNASENRSYKEVVQVLDWLRQMGGPRVALGTLSKRGSGPDGNKAIGNLDSFFSGNGLNPNTVPTTPTSPIAPSTGIPTMPMLQPDGTLSPSTGTPLPPPPNSFETNPQTSGSN